MLGLLIHLKGDPEHLLQRSGFKTYNMEQRQKSVEPRVMLLEDFLEEIRAQDDGNPLVNFDDCIVVKTLEEMKRLTSEARRDAFRE